MTELPTVILESWKWITTNTTVTVYLPKKNNRRLYVKFTDGHTDTLVPIKSLFKNLNFYIKTVIWHGNKDLMIER